MAFELPTLPYSKSALGAKGMCEETLDLHHGKHHQAYVTALNGFVEKDPSLQGKSLEEIVKMTHGNADKAPVFNNAGQHWNHIVFWQCMSPNGGRIPGALEKKITEDLGGVHAVQGCVQGRRRQPVRLRLGVAGARQGRQAEGDQDRRTAPTRWPPAKARCCSAATCGSTATTWTSATAARTTCRTGSITWRTTNTPRRS